MSGSKTNGMTRKQVLDALKNPPAGGYYVWDGKDDDERPATAEEMAAAVSLDRKKRGRPPGSGTKEQVAIRIDVEVLEAFRAAGPGWQTKMNAALKDWLKDHSPA